MFSYIVGPTTNRLLYVRPVVVSAVGRASSHVLPWLEGGGRGAGDGRSVHTTCTTSPTRRCFGSAAAPPPKKQDDKDKQASLIDKQWLFPGIGASVVTAAVGFDLAALLSTGLSMPVSGIPVSILLGMGIRNTIGVHKIMDPGIKLTTKSVLQVGIVCVAAKLSFLELWHAGTSSLPVVVCSVAAGLWFIPAAGALAGLPQKMSLLLAAGTSICGVTAITALAPAIRASPRDIAVAVANTVAFGSVGMILYPYLFHAVCTSSEQVGMCLGVAIHDTSQVLGSALSYKEAFADDVAFKVAAVTKLMRNLGLAVAIPLLTYQHHKSMEASNNENQQAENDLKTTETGSSQLSGLNSFTKYVPPFLVAFLGMSVFRTTGDLVFADLDAYHQVMNFTGNDVSKYLLGTAMAGIGLSTDKSSLQGVGWKPFAVGLSGALVVGGTGFTVAMLTV